MKALIFADYVCPFCYLELPALERLQKEKGVELDYWAFELRPEPAPTLDPKGEYLRDTWQRSVYPLAASLGMQIKLPPVQPRSRMAFEGLLFAKARGRAHEYNRAVYEAFFLRGEDIGQLDVLAAIAQSVGLDAAQFRSAIGSHVHLPRVLADEEQAARLGIKGVPAVILNERIISGCVPYEQLRSAVERR